jgi:L-Ala-D/L-Glu epimerase
VTRSRRWSKTGSQSIIEASLSAAIERWPVAGAFKIARGARTFVDVVVVEASARGAMGRGEGTPIYYRGESAENCRAQVAALPPRIDRLALQHRLPPGAARNAADCALWDLEAKLANVPVWRLAGLDPPCPLLTAMTVSLGDPAAMEESARRLAALTPLIKVKLAGDGDEERLAGVRRGAPYARLIVDANESWTGSDIAARAAALERFTVELIEQPVAAGADAALDGIASPIPFCADESVHDRADLATCIGRYAAINIKLDKAGGLTEALALRAAARAAGLKVMVGCMLSTSLGIAPAWLAAQGCEWADLDGPLLLAKDRNPGLRIENGLADLVE